MVGSAGLAASQAAMEMMDKVSAQTTMMNAAASTQKMQTDTMNSIANGRVDSATKASNAATQSSKSINY
ncbi:ATP-dependent helicase HrpA [Vibrio mangrovi]|uniref:ATP-dependent helicase HrpA n=1 Tax=Vibrio mangrovi TaxID=474394 RepID=A0A1Y6IXY9_9VIBR|nr:ATP-dependent helicase HrpA [Vibrio mangrovi]MDW6001954.1 ATP-dependent helicase HrpA [Vibrio mangrovi]SMS02498.1 hypothetical protein VIM7927_03831 [Vibrio mangrovi]